MSGYLVYWIDEEEMHNYEKVFLNKSDALNYADSEQKTKNNQGRKVDYYVTKVDIV